MATAMRSLRAGSRLIHVQLPSSIRASIYQHTTSKRCFSSTTARRADLTTTIASAPAALLDCLHAFMPWYIAIPTAAVLVRGCLVYRVASLPNRKRAIVRRHLYPLWSRQARLAWVHQHERTLREARERGGRGGTHPATALWALVKKQWINLQASHLVGRYYGAPALSWRSFFNFAIMIAFTEALRIKCGSKTGLLPIILHPIEWAKDLVANPVPKESGESDVKGMSPDELLVQRLEKAREAQDAGELSGGVTDIDNQLLAQAHHLSPLNTSEYAAYLDSTLQAEGLSWCPDLTAIDPTSTLPVALSLTIAASAFLRSSRDLEQPQKQRSKASQKESAAKVEAAKATSQTAKPGAQSSKPTADSFQAALQKADKIKVLAPVKKDGPLAHLNFRQRMTLTISLLFFLMALKLPTALLLYLVPSFAVGLLQGKWLDMKYPLPETIKASKRPMRMKVRKTFGEV